MVRCTFTHKLEEALLKYEYIFNLNRKEMDKLMKIYIKKMKKRK